MWRRCWDGEPFSPSSRARGERTPVSAAAAERQAISAPIQGTAADILKIAIIELDQQLKARELSSRIVPQVHDEVVLEVPQEELKEARVLTRGVMEDAHPLLSTIQKCTKITGAKVYHFMSNAP